MQHYCFTEWAGWEQRRQSELSSCVHRILDPERTVRSPGFQRCCIFWTVQDQAWIEQGQYGRWPVPLDRGERRAVGDALRTAHRKSWKQVITVLKKWKSGVDLRITYLSCCFSSCINLTLSLSLSFFLSFFLSFSLSQAIYLSIVSISIHRRPGSP